MPQNQFAPTPGVSTLEDARDVWNGNAFDAEARLAISEPGSVTESGSSVSLELNTIGKTIVCTNATGTTISPGPTSSAPIGSQWTVVQATENGVIDFVDVSSTGFRFPRFSGEESDGQWATIKIVKVTADDYVCSGDLKVKQPAARFEFDSASVPGSNQQIDFNSAGGIGGSSSGIFTTQGTGGAVKFLVPGIYSFSGALVIEDSNNTSERQVGLTLRKNGSTIFSFQGLRESSSPSIRAMVHVFGTQRFEVDDLVTLTTNSGSTTSFPGNSASRQIWVTRISD